MVARWVVLVVWVLYAVSAHAVSSPRCPSNTLQRCSQGRQGHDEYKYTVDGWDLLIVYTESGYFFLQCSGNLTLDNPALPRFETQLRVGSARLDHCPPPPPHSSYAAVLAALNVVVVDKLSLIGTGRLTRDMFEGLERLKALELENLNLRSDVQDALPPLELETKSLELSPCVPDALSPALKIKSWELTPCALYALRSLRRLRLSGVRSPPGEPLRLPLTLEVLHLVRTGIEMPAAALARLPHLVDLKVRDSERVVMIMTDVQQKLGLKELALEAKAVRISAELLPSLHQLTLQGWDEPKPMPLSACDALETLDMRDATAEKLPTNWLRSCKSLRVLRLNCKARQLSSLKAGVLRGLQTLEELRVKACGLTTLDADLLDDAQNLRVLDFSGNLLFMLPGMFASTKSLQELDLSRNRLTTDVFTSLSAVTSLRKLRLDHNVNLKDSCGGAYYTLRGTSPLQNLKKLTELSLTNTSAEMICRDWRESMPLLTKLDLAMNSITSITYEDIQFHGIEDVIVNLVGNNITNVYYTSDDYYQVLNDTEASRANVQLDVHTTLRCDCHDYWAALALRKRPAHVRLQHATCASGVLLEHAQLDDLVCVAPALCDGAPPGCACATRDRPGEPARLLRLDCEFANLTRIPDVTRLPNITANDYAWHLRLAYNHIDNLRARDLPEHLTAIDLRNNSLTEMSVSAALALVKDSRRRVWLAHNPLSCACAAADTLATLRASRGVLADYDVTPCAGAEPAPCVQPRAAALGAALALLGAAALCATAALPALRMRAKLLLQALGWLPGAAPADGRQFDVFVSFSHGDERFVRSQLVARLESGPAPYRLCVHYRDWAPGGWIPAQIAASVRASRRTLAVVSQHFLRSAWARAELREAYGLALRDAEPRLVVVLLDAPERLPLDDKLRDYLATNTYVRWGDPWFWQKLRLALPRSTVPPQVQSPVVTPTPGVPQVSVESPVMTPTPGVPQVSVESPVMTPTPGVPQVSVESPVMTPTPGVPQVSVESPVMTPTPGVPQVSVESPVMTPTPGVPQVSVESPVVTPTPGVPQVSVESPVVTPTPGVPQVSVESPVVTPTPGVPQVSVESPEATPTPVMPQESIMTPSSVVTSAPVTSVASWLSVSCSAQYNGDVTSDAMLPVHAHV